MVLINAVKDVAKTLGDLISATKAAAGKAGDDPTVYQLKNSAKVCTGAQWGEGNGAGGLEKAGRCFCACLGMGGQLGGSQGKGTHKR